MRHLLFAIKDTALNSFMQIWQAQTTAAANRAFQDGVNDTQTPMNKHPDDYELWILGEWDADTGIVKGETPALLTRAKDVIQQK